MFKTISGRKFIVYVSYYFHLFDAKRNIILLLKILFFLLGLFVRVTAQNKPYIDGRPSTSLRVECTDHGVILRHGDGKDSCDIYGAREAIVNKVDGKYYLFYDGAGKKGWLACLAESNDLLHWRKKGAILTLGDSSENDSKSASAPWVIKNKGMWHMFYLGTPNTSPPPDRIPAFPYLTMKAHSESIKGPWEKQYNVHPFTVKSNSFYAVTSSPGFIIRYQNEFLQIFSGASLDSTGATKRTLGLARTKNLDSTWVIDSVPLFSPTEQVENSSIFFDKGSKTWYLFTNHIGITKENGEYTDAIWMYWSKNIYEWNEENKAIVLDKSNCTWAKGTIGMPSVVKIGTRLALLYDGAEGNSTSHMKRDIGLAYIPLPIKIYNTIQ